MDTFLSGVFPSEWEAGNGGGITRPLSVLGFGYVESHEQCRVTGILNSILEGILIEYGSLGFLPKFP